MFVNVTRYSLVTCSFSFPKIFTYLKSYTAQLPLLSDTKWFVEARFDSPYKLLEVICYQEVTRYRHVGFDGVFVLCNLYNRYRHKRDRKCMKIVPET